MTNQRINQKYLKMKNWVYKFKHVYLSREFLEKRFRE